MVSRETLEILLGMSLQLGMSVARWGMPWIKGSLEGICDAVQLCYGRYLGSVDMFRSSTVSLY